MLSSTSRSSTQGSLHQNTGTIVFNNFQAKKVDQSITGQHFDFNNESNKGHKDYVTISVHSFFCLFLYVLTTDIL